MAALVSRRTPARTSTSVELLASMVRSPSRMETRAAVGGSCAGVGGGGGVAGTCACGGGSGCLLPFLFFADTTAALAPADLEPPCLVELADDCAGPLLGGAQIGVAVGLAAVCASSDTPIANRARTCRDDLSEGT